MVPGVPVAVMERATGHLTLDVRSRWSFHYEATGTAWDHCSTETDGVNVGRTSGRPV